MKNKRIDSLDYRYTKLYIHFYCVSDNNEMRCIILAPPTMLVKIRHW